MTSNRLLLLFVLLPLAIEPACAPNEEEADAAAEHARTGAVSSGLLAYSKTLWPMKDGAATIRVCWLPYNDGGQVFPVASLAPNIPTALAERKQWIQRAAEREWNGRTVLKFVGWKDCGAEPADVQIEPTSSTTTFTCVGNQTTGGWCVEAFGQLGRGKRVHLNMLFGDELLYVMKYKRSGRTDNSQNIKSLTNPGLCTTEVNAAVADPSAANEAAFVATWERCLAQAALHELGHVAGFAHEQNRRDDQAKAEACLSVEGKTLSDLGAYDPERDGDLPLAAFDSESVMSYCRTEKAATLSNEDVEQTNDVYRRLAPKVASDVTGGGDSPEDPPADDGTEPTQPKPRPKPKHPAYETTSGGCNASGRRVTAR